MQFFLLGSITIINIILWLIFLLKFKKLFSTDDIISKTRDELNSLIKDINNNTQRDITLVDDRIKQLKAVVAEADRRLNAVREQTKKEQLENQYTIKLNEGITKAKTKTLQQNVVDKYKKNSSTTVKEKKNKEENMPELFFSEKPIKPKIDFPEQVRKLYDMGKSIDEIAVELSRSTTEVQFVLDINS